MSAPTDRLRNFGFLIGDIGRLYTKLFEYEAEHLGLNMAEAKVLACLSRNAGLNQVQLAELSGVEPMSLVRILDRMEADNLLERRPHPTDRRARQLHLKAQAQATVEQIWHLSDQMRTQAFGKFKSEERNALIDLLERVHVKLLEMIAERARKPAQRTVTEPKNVERRGAPVRARSRNGKTQRALR